MDMGTQKLKPRFRICLFLLCVMPVVVVVVVVIRSKVCEVGLFRCVVRKRNHSHSMTSIPRCLVCAGVEYVVCVSADVGVECMRECMRVERFV